MKRDLIQKAASAVLGLFVATNLAAAFASSYGFPQQAEDAGHTSGQYGCPMLGVRKDDSQASMTSADADYGIPSISAASHLRVDVAAPNSYQCCTGFFTPAASATDMATIYPTGSTKNVRIQRIYVSYYAATGAGCNHFYLAKRTAADSGGTAVPDTEIAMDSNNASTTAAVQHYTANPTNGAGTDIDIITQSPENNSASFNSWAKGGRSVIYEEPVKGQGIVLHGTSEGVAIHNNSTTVYGTSPKVCFTFQWVEE